MKGLNAFGGYPTKAVKVSLVGVAPATTLIGHPASMDSPMGTT